MARRSGRNGRVYLDITDNAAGPATPISTVMSWSLSQTRDSQESTCLGDSSKQYVRGLPDATGSFSGLLDLGVKNWMTIADGNPRAMYVYPDRANHAGVYFSGLVTCDISSEGSVNGLVSCTVNFAAASDVTWTGTY